MPLNLTVDIPKHLVGKEALYNKRTSTITNVRKTKSGMVLVYTDQNWVLNILIIKIKNDKGEWVKAA